MKNITDEINRMLNEGMTEDEIMTQLTNTVNETFEAKRQKEDLDEKKDAATKAICSALYDYYEMFYPTLAHGIDKERFFNAEIFKRTLDNLGEKYQGYFVDPETEAEESDVEKCAKEPTSEVVIDTYEKVGNEPEKRTHKTYTAEEADEIISKFFKRFHL